MEHLADGREGDFMAEEILDDYEFEEEDFDTINHNGRRLRRGRKRSYVQYVLGLVALAIIVFIGIKVHNWNKGVESDYDPTEDTSEFDVEPNDYIQPLSGDQLSGKVDDGKNTIMVIGNSPFADNYATNNLATSFGNAYDADVINVSFADSYITCKESDYNSDNPEDGVSLYNVAKAIATGDSSVVREAADAFGDDARMAADVLASTDISTIDTIFIMYNLEDYKDHRPLGSEDKEDITCIYGAVYSSIKMIQEAYPYIRIVMLSQPAGGVTIDDFFVDGDQHDIGCGLLSDYVTFELEATASRGASFVDVYYGAINIEERDEYLYDDYHINDAGAEAIVARVKKLIK